MEVTDDPSLPSGNSSCLTDQQRSRAAPFVEKEHLFDKVVTPSDVGKLNRLVIPKQHAEKHFPLDASANEKGLMLSFEDRTGRSWRFRYSYWNSSQSYVMTRGWSRFVKEKRLDAGDTVSFGRGVGATGRGRFFIDWKHRPDPHDLLRLPHRTLPSQNYHHHNQDPSLVMPFVVRTGIPLNHLVWPPPTLAVSAVTTYAHQANLDYGYNPHLYRRPEAGPPQAAVQLGVGSSGEGGLCEPGVFNSVSMLESNAVAKTVRLFGVNLYCSAAEADRDDGAVGQGEKMRSYNRLDAQSNTFSKRKGWVYMMLHRQDPYV